MTLLLVSQRSNERKTSKHSNFHMYLNQSYCPHWPPCTVDVRSMHLSKASLSSWRQTSALPPAQGLTPAIASFSPALSMFPVYSSTGYFPSAHKHTVRFHILKKEPLLTHTSSSCLSISQILLTEKPVEQTIFRFFSNFSPFILS